MQPRLWGYTVSLPKNILMGLWLMANLLEIENLTVELMSHRGIVYALSGVDLAVRPGEIHGVVGESGCGKSMTAKSILRLHNPQRSRMRGSIRFEGKELLTLSNREIEKMRGTDISMIFQDPMTSLNPLMTIGGQIADMYRFHTGASKKEAMEKAQEMLAKVGIEPAAKRCRQYPFELSPWPSPAPPSCSSPMSRRRRWT